MTASDTPPRRRRDDLLLEVDHLVVRFPLGRRDRVVHAVNDVSFDLAVGETLGLVGESGCGKSSTARAVLQLPRPTGGRVRFAGTELTTARGAALREARRGLQVLFQDPASSLNPMRRVRDLVAEPLAAAGPGGAAGDHRAAAETILARVGIEAALGERRARELSGGQCQRVALARALVAGPRLLICDEPVSALDVSVQAQVLNLLEELKAEHQLTLLFISHDLAVVGHVADRVAVMHLGRLCEVGATDAVYRRPAHPYTAALLDAVPDPARRLRSGAAGSAGSDARGQWHADPGHRRGEAPSAASPPSGCAYRTRCPRAEPRCAEEVPALRAVGADHFVACHAPLGTPVLPPGVPPGVPVRAPARDDGEHHRAG